MISNFYKFLIFLFIDNIKCAGVYDECQYQDGWLGTCDLVEDCSWIKREPQHCDTSFVCCPPELQKANPTVNVS